MFETILKVAMGVAGGAYVLFTNFLVGQLIGMRIGRSRGSVPFFASIQLNITKWQ